MIIGTRLLVLAALLAAPTGYAQTTTHDSTVCVAFRTRTSTTGAITSTSVAKVGCGVARVDTITITRTDTVKVTRVDTVATPTPITPTPTPAPTPVPTPIPPGDAEPRPTATSTFIFRDDFERYDGSCRALTAIGAWATSDDNCSNTTANITTPTDAGSTGSPTTIVGRALRIAWPISTSEQFYIAEHPVSGFSGRQPEYFSYDYRAPGFVYVGAYPRVGKKMFLLLVGGSQTGRVTINPTEWGMLQSNGVHLNPDFDHYPPGITSKAAYTAYLTDGRWHRYTLMRLPESSNGAMDGLIRLWVDGYLVVDYQRAGTYIGNTSSIDVAGTFNGGSSKMQVEYYDNVVAWR